MSSAHHHLRQAAGDNVFLAVEVDVMGARRAREDAAGREREGWAVEAHHAVGIPTAFGSDLLERVGLRLRDGLLLIAHREELTAARLLASGRGWRWNLQRLPLGLLGWRQSFRLGRLWRVAAASEKLRADHRPFRGVERRRNAPLSDNLRLVEAVIGYVASLDALHR